MGIRQKLAQWIAGDPAPYPVQASAPTTVTRVAEAAGAQSADEPGYRRLTGDGLGSHNERDLTPMAQDKMQRLAEYLWQSNGLANRLVELPLAYLLAEGVTLQCSDEDHQKALNAFWTDPINNWPMKLEPRVRALSMLGEQCYVAHVNDGNGKVRLGYLDPRHIAQVVMDPDNPEQPIGVVTKKDTRGQYHKYRVIILGDDADHFTQRTCEIRAQDFMDGDCLLFQINKFPNGSRGRSDMLGQMDWLDAYEDFLFGEIDRSDYLRRFVWDVTMTGADQPTVDKYKKDFQPPAANGVFVHNDSIKLEAKSPGLQAADTSHIARLLRNHVLGGATMPEHWFGGGGDVNRAAASEMGEPTFKMYTARQTMLKLMLEEIGRFVLWSGARKRGEAADWSSDAWQVTAVFPELVNKDVTKFASAMGQVVSAVLQMIEGGLLTEETGLKLIRDVALRFGQDFDAKAELDAARSEHAARRKARAAEDAFNLPGDVRDALGKGTAGPAPAPAPAEATE